MRLWMAERSRIWDRVVTAKSVPLPPELSLPITVRFVTFFSSVKVKARVKVVLLTGDAQKHITCSYAVGGCDL